MKNLIVFIILAIVIIGFVKIAKADAPLTPERELKDYSVKELIDYFSIKYNVSAEKMYKTINCESSFNEDAVHISKRERSYGLSQINLLAHPDVTIEQATEKVFAVEFMAQEFSKGNAKIWSCFTKFYK